MKKLSVAVYAVILLGGSLLLGGLTGLLLVHLDRPKPAAFAQLAVDDIAHKLGIDKLPAFNTLDEAALHGAEELVLCSTHYECAVTIAKRPDGTYTAGATLSDRSSDSVRPHLVAPPPWVVVASIHSHPCLDDSHFVHYFSPEDTIGDITDDVVGYMLDLCTGEVHKFVPGQTPLGQDVVESTDGEVVHLTRGEIIGKVKVPGGSVEPKRIVQ